MKVFELAKKLNKKSKEILDAAKYLNIQIKSHLSNLNDDEVKLIIKYFRKRRFIFFFKKYLTPLLLIFLLTISFFINNCLLKKFHHQYRSILFVLLIFR